MYDETFLRHAIALSARAMTLPGTEPFGAVVVREGRIVGTGLNRSRLHSDPTSHGETEAIRDACRRLGTVDLRGCALYSSCEPCPMCVAAMGIAGISVLYYAAGMDQAGAALGDLPEAARFPVDVARLVQDCGSDVTQRQMPAHQHLAAEAAEVLMGWASMARDRARTGG